jgi:hypothetical protein
VDVDAEPCEPDVDAEWVLVLPLEAVTATTAIAAMTRPTPPRKKPERFDISSFLIPGRFLGPTPGLCAAPCRFSLGS